MAKLKDVLKLFNEQISSQELEAVVSSSDPMAVDITDEGFSEIKSQVEGLLTVESAQTNKDVKKALYKLHEKTIKTDLEEKLAAIADKLEAKEGYKSAKTVEEKIEFLTESLDEFKKDVPDESEALKKYKKDVADLNEQISKLTEDSEQKINETKSEYEQRLLKKAFHTHLSNNYKLAEAYQKGKIKQSLFDDAFHEVSKTAILKLNDDDQLEVFDKENPDKPVYIKNKPAGVDDLVSPTLQDYLQVSDPKPPADPKGPKEPTKPVHEPGTFGAEMARNRQQYLKEMSA